MAVNDVEPKEDGDVQARLLHGDVLVVVGPLGTDHIEHRTHLPLGDQFVIGQVRGRRTGCESG